MTKILSQLVDASGADAFTPGTALVFYFDGGGADIVVGQKFDFPDIPFNCNPERWTITADAAGSASVDILRSTYAAFPTVASIAGTEKPSLVAAQKAQDTALTTWSTIVQGDILRAQVVTISAGIKQLTITVWVRRT